jgi:hypothetical protein
MENSKGGVAPPAKMEFGTVDMVCIIEHLKFRNAKLRTFKQRANDKSQICTIIAK